MDTATWPEAYLSDQGSHLDTSSLVNDFKTRYGFLNLSPAENSIFRSTLEALIWSYPLNQTYRLYNLNTRTQAPANALFKPDFAASWLNQSSSPAPNASVLYIPAWLDLSKVDETDHGEQVLQLPKNPDNAYYILAVLDAYINTVGSFGPRTIPKGGSEFPQNILLVGPDSPYYGKDIQDITIQGTTLPVLQVDTAIAWITARIETNTLDADAMTATRAFINGMEEESGSGFQLTSLKTFKDTGVVPYAKPISQTTTNQAARQTWGEIPTRADAFFRQVSEALALNPVPAELETHVIPPSYQIWIGNQNTLQNSETLYQPPSALQPEDLAALNARFSAIGLNLNTGFAIPSNWTAQEKVVFQESYRYGLNLLNQATTALVEGNAGINNGWNISNKNIGVYPNTWSSWLVRAGVAVQGGAANIPDDAVYPTTEIDHEGHSLTSTFNYRIALPATAGQAPLKTESYAPAQGFWAFTIYQPNPGNAYQPFLIENAIQNTAYSPINSTATLTADGRLKTTKPGNWNRSTAVGTALLTGSELDLKGIDANTIYYVNQAEEVGDELLVSLSSDYQSVYAPNGIPIGGAGFPTPGSELTLKGSPGSSLTFGWINPVAQLGSSQLAGETSATTTLATEIDGAIDLRLSSLSPQANVQNWLPTPLVSGSGSSDPAKASEFQVMVRYYWPTTETPSVLAPNDRRQGAADLYAPPIVERLGLNRLHTWDLLSAESEAKIKQSDPDFGSSSPLDTPSPFNSDVVGALIDFRFLPDALDGQSAAVHYTFSRSADDNNQLFFYAIDDITGSLDGLAPGDRNYLDEAWSQRLQASAPIEAEWDAISEGTLELQTGQLYAPIVETGDGRLITAFDRANADGYRHFDLRNTSSFAFEDLLNGGQEHDRNDGIFTITSIDL